MTLDPIRSVSHRAAGSLLGLSLAVAMSACGSGAADSASGSSIGPGVGPDGTGPGATADGGVGTDGSASSTAPSLHISLTGSASILVAPGSKTRVDVRVARIGPRRPVVLHLAGFGTDFVAPDVTVAAADDAASLHVTASQAVTSQQMNGTIEAKDGALAASTSLTLGGASEVADPTFGAQGTVTVGQPIRDVLPLPDGRIVVSLRGTVGSPLRPVRMYDAHGAPDTTFGTNGETNVGRPTGYFSTGEGSMAVQADGRILYATSIRPYAAGSTFSLGVARLLPTGALDTTFGNQGWAQVPFAGFADAFATGLVLEADGGMVVAGSLSVDGLFADPLKRRAGLARFTSTGAPDGGFGSNGAVVMAWGGTNGNTEGIRVIGGATYVMGYGDPTVQGASYFGHIGRLTANGALDASFGTGGMVKTSTGILDVLVPSAGLAAGKLLVAYDGGSYGGSVGLVSATTGAADTSVSASGRFSHVQGGATSYGGPALPVLDSSGRVLVLMGSIDHQRLEVLAYSGAGVPDMAYAGVGTLQFASAGTYVDPVRAVPHPDGRIVVAANGADGTAVLGAFFP